jgi:S-adenosylmethionine synthetase
VTVEYVEDKVTRIDTIVLSTQHSPEVNHKTIYEALVEEVAKKCIPLKLLDNQTRFLINPTGRFVIGGPQGDCGLTGRKIIVDTYGGMGHHGGGAFSGKDPTKVDRSASYMGRYIAKNIVAAKLAKKCEVQIAYAIGFAEPVSVTVNTFETSEIPNDQLTMAIREVFQLKPAGIIKELNLLRPIYRKTASYGHFGRNDPDFQWEKTDKVDKLQKILNF